MPSQSSGQIEISRTEQVYLKMKKSKYVLIYDDQANEILESESHVSSNDSEFDSIVSISKKVPKDLDAGSEAEIEQDRKPALEPTDRHPMVMRESGKYYKMY